MSSDEASKTAQASGEVRDAGAYIPGFDGLRAIAVGAVFLLHLDRPVFPGGAFGVDVFFVLSAYLITGLLVKERAETGGVSYRQFYWRRFFRLYPALVLWALLIAIPTALIELPRIAPWLSFLGALFYFNDFLQAWTHLVPSAFDQSWSLAVEEQFYLVWPVFLGILAVLFSHKLRGFLLWGLLLMSAIVSLFFGNYFLPTGHLFSLGLGAAGAFYRGGDPRKWLNNCISSPLTGPFAVLCFLLAGFGILNGQLAFLIVDFSAVAVILHVDLCRNSVSSRLLGSFIPRWVGARSYGVYLYGLTLMQLIPVVFHLPLHIAAFVDVAVTFLVVGISYKFVEAPLRLRGRLWLRSKAVRIPQGDTPPAPESG